MFVLLGAGQALAAPTWLAGESHDGAAAATGVPADVATDSGGNSVAVWAANTAAGGEVRAAFRPRGGPWGAPESLDGELSTQSGAAARRRAAERRVRRRLARQQRRHRAPLGAPPGGRRLERRRHDRPRHLLRHQRAAGERGRDRDRDPRRRRLRRDLHQGAGLQCVRRRGARCRAAADFAAAADGSVVGGPERVPLQRRPLRRRPAPAARRTLGGRTSRWPTSPSATRQRLRGHRQPRRLLHGGVGRGSRIREGIAPPGRVLSSDRQAGDAGAWADLAARRGPPGRHPRLRRGCVDVRDRRGRGAARPLEAGRRDGGRAAARGAGSAWSAPETAGTAPGPARSRTARSPPAACPWPRGTRACAAGAVDRHAPRGRRLASGRARRRAGPGQLPRRTSFLGDLAADGEGDALTAWRDRQRRLRPPASTPPAPRFTAFSLPVGGSAGQALPFSAAADDNWSGPPSISWLFGDGGPARRARRSPTPTRRPAATSRPRAPPTDAHRQRHRAVRAGRPWTAAPCATGGTRRRGQGRHHRRLRHQQRRRAAEGVQDRQRHRRLRRGVREAARRLQRRRARRRRKPPKGFKRLLGAETIPVGATLDTAHGRVKVRSAADTEAKKLQSGQFFRGRFTIRQSRIKKRSKKLITELRLTGSSFKKACSQAKASISAKKKKLEEARPAPVRQRQGLVPHQRAQRGGDRPRHALERPGPLRRHAGDRPARPRRGPRQGQAQDGHRAHGPHVPRQSPLTPAR